MFALLFFLAVFLFSAWQVAAILVEYRQGAESYENLTQEYTTRQPIAPTQKAENLEAEIADSTPAPAEQAPVAVDFAAIQAEYPDVVGWLYCADTPINYPVVQAEDNDYYVYRLLDGTYNSSGSIFMDCRCAADFSDWNSIVYGHNMKNDTMFGTLQEYREQAYYDAHPVLYLLTPTRDYRIELIGGYTTPGTAGDTFDIPSTPEERDALIAKALLQSTFQSEVEIEDTDRLITLSTCAYEFEDARYVLVGVLK